MRQLRIEMAQINTTVGDFVGNTKKILKTIGEVRPLGVDLLTFPKLAICGYPRIITTLVSRRLSSAR